MKAQCNIGDRNCHGVGPNHSQLGRKALELVEDADLLVNYVEQDLTSRKIGRRHSAATMAALDTVREHLAAAHAGSADAVTHLRDAHAALLALVGGTDADPQLDEPDADDMPPDMPMHPAKSSPWSFIIPKAFRR